MVNSKISLVIVGSIITIIAVIVVFTNIGQLIYDDVITQGYSNVISQVKVSNPLQTYKIDSKCDLSYFMLEKMVTQKKSPLEIAGEASAMYYSDEKSKAIAAKYPDRYNDEAEYRKMLLDIFESFALNPFMQENSVHPKLEPVVRKWLSVSSPFSPDFNGAQIGNALLNIIRLSDKDFAEDPECAKKHREYFSDTMETLKNKLDY